MSIIRFIHPQSLSGTVDALSEAIADRARISAGDRTEVARWIASRQGLPGAYGGTFAPFEQERRDGIRLFTGERATSASARHILGEESCRVLLQLRVRDPIVGRALGRATEGLLECLARSAVRKRIKNPGLFCCGPCTVGLWRHLAVGGLDRQEERLERGVSSLRARRDGLGGWRRFPFWYTVLLLSELDRPYVKAELRYIAPALERAVRRAAANPYAARRRAAATRALSLL